MGKQKAPPPPNYAPIAQASSEAAQYSYNLGREQLAWAKEQYKRDSATNDRIVDAFLDAQEKNSATAAADRARYEQVFQPLENEFVKRAQAYGSPARQEADAARAAGDVSQQFNLARDNARAALEAYGVDPSQTRAGALDLGTRTQEAAARASAANTARMQTEARGDAMRAAAIDIGRGYPGSIATQYGTANQAGAAAGNATNAATLTGAQTMGTGAQWQGLGNNSLGQWANALTSGYNAQLQRFNANQQASSGLGSLLGLGLGIGSKAFGLFEEGGVAPDMNEERHGGIPIRASMSPSMGVEVDDVPARLNAGEFVVPADTLRWFGEKHFQKMIEKGREESDQAVAKPRVGVLPVGG